MSSKRIKLLKKNKTRRIKEDKKYNTGKKWLSAINIGSKTFKKTGSIYAAKKALNKQALYNARILFGSVGGRLK